MEDTPATYMDSVQLYEGCQQADPSAYRVLWDYLYRIAYQMLARNPDAVALAQDCAQQALVRIYHDLDSCRSPEAFRSWSRRIVTHLIIDELRRRKRLQSYGDGTEVDELALQSRPQPSHLRRTAERAVLARMTLDELRTLLNLAPISDRSRRVVIGRYLDDEPDETLAAVEAELAGSSVLPSHIQVTRAKNMAKLRRWEQLEAFLTEAQA